ncbi:MAG: hypothetical protein EPO55_21175, partial [Reyranella sp.]|uniref:hypothetical protein n=1 Tax=Reyranella sp. TaxID=1929291 RepID=UPI001217AAED
MKKWSTPPQADELEVCIYGPGIGESILVHIGNSQWLCIDSAKSKHTAWPLVYLSELGLDPAKCIKLIVATHWHADHVDGLSQIVEACPGVQFVCSEAVTVAEFKQILQLPIVNTDVLKSAHREIRQVFRTIVNRFKADPLHPVAIHAGLNKRLAPELNVEIWALSPSPADLARSKLEFQNLYDPSAAPTAAIKENTECVVLYIKIGDQVLLLGSDLEHNNHPQSGWKSVLAAPIRNTPASMFKIPHHGSEGAHSPSIWTTALQQAAIAVVTPYTRSTLPQQNQLDLYTVQSQTTFATALPKAVSVTRPPAVAKRTLNRIKAAYAVNQDMSFVRLRKKAGEHWQA